MGKAFAESFLLAGAMALSAVCTAGSPDNRQVEVRVRRTPGGPKLFVDGKRHLSRSVLVCGNARPQRLGMDWRRFETVMTALTDRPEGVLHFRFEKKTYYGGIERPDGWVRLRGLSVTDETTGAVLVREDTFANDAAFRANWSVHDDGELGGVTVETGGVLRVDVRKPRKRSKEWSLTTRGNDFHVGTKAFPVRKGGRYRVRYEACADREQDLYPTAYQIPGFIAAPLSPNPFEETVRLAKEHGVDIVIPNGSGAVWRRDGTLDFDKCDADFDRVLAVNPDALIIARFGVRPPSWMFEEHPDWRTTYADGSTQDDESVSCRPWRDYSARLVRELARHLMEKYPRNFAGLHIAAHRAGEWLYEDMLCGKLGGYDVHTRTAWRRFLAAQGEPDAGTAEVPDEATRRAAADGEMLPDPVAERRLILFHRFLNEEMADRIAELAAVARAATEGRKLVAFFYGYSYEVASSGPNSGHYALDYLLKKAAGDIDFLCGPFSYGDRRTPDTRPVMAPADTMARYGVAWWNEDDTRTYLETNPDALQSQGGKPLTKTETLFALERNNRQNAVRNHGYWWMDLRGRGWFLDDDLWKVMDATRPFERTRLASDEPYAPAVATIVSETSVLHRRTAHTWTSSALLGNAQREFERAGVATGQYLLEDALTRDIPARIRFYLASWYLSKADRARLRAQRASRPDLVRVWMWASGLLDEDGKDIAKVEDATGFRVRPVSSPSYPNAKPLLAVEPREDDEVWSRYEDGSAAVVCRPLPGGGAEIFHAPPLLSRETIRRVLKTGGASAGSGI